MSESRKELQLWLTLIAILLLRGGDQRAHAWEGAAAPGVPSLWAAQGTAGDVKPWGFIHPDICSPHFIHSVYRWLLLFLYISIFFLLNGKILRLRQFKITHKTVWPWSTTDYFVSIKVFNFYKQQALPHHLCLDLDNAHPGLPYILYY